MYYTKYTPIIDYIGYVWLHSEYYLYCSYDNNNLLSFNERASTLSTYKIKMPVNILKFTLNKTK